QRDRLINGLDPDNGEHRTEDLLPIDVHLGRDLVDHRWADEEAVLVARHDVSAAVDRDRGALALARVDQADDALLGLLGDDWAHLAFDIPARAHLHRAGALVHRGDYAVARVAHCDGHRDRHAALTRRPEGSGGEV